MLDGNNSIDGIYFVSILIFFYIPPRPAKILTEMTLERRRKIWDRINKNRIILAHRIYSFIFKHKAFSFDNMFGDEYQFRLTKNSFNNFWGS